MPTLMRCLHCGGIGSEHDDLCPLMQVERPRKAAVFNGCLHCSGTLEHHYPGCVAEKDMLLAEAKWLLERWLNEKNLHAVVPDTKAFLEKLT